MRINEQHCYIDNQGQENEDIFRRMKLENKKESEGLLPIEERELQQIVNRGISETDQTIAKLNDTVRDPLMKRIAELRKKEEEGEQ